MTVTDTLAYYDTESITTVKKVYSTRPLLNFMSNYSLLSQFYHLLCILSYLYWHLWKTIKRRGWYSPFFCYNLPVIIKVVRLFLQRANLLV
jgi:hypothetical protein